MKKPDFSKSFWSRRIQTPKIADALVSLSFCGKNQPIGVWVESEKLAQLNSRIKNTVGSTFSTGSAEPIEIALTSHDSDGLIESEILVGACPVAFPTAQLLADGSFLLVGARSERSGPEAGCITPS